MLSAQNTSVGGRTEMTNPEILKLAETCGIIPNKYKVCISWEEELLKFALLINEKGYNRGYKEGYGEGRYDGYESAKVSTEMNTMEFDDD